jgi:hypothetical protein
MVADKKKLTTLFDFTGTEYAEIDNVIYAAGRAFHFDIRGYVHRVEEYGARTAESYVIEINKLKRQLQDMASKRREAVRELEETKHAQRIKEYEA